jgi:hypothetical protein
MSLAIAFLKPSRWNKKTVPALFWHTFVATVFIFVAADGRWFKHQMPQQAGCSM